MGGPPRLLMILTENWTMRPVPDVGDLVTFAVEAERAGLDGVMVSEHVVLGPSANAAGLPANPRDYALPGNQDPATPWPPRAGSSLGATVFVAGASVAVLLVNQLWTGLFALPATPHYFAMFAWGSTFGGFALVVVYLLMSVGSLKDFKDSERRATLIVSALVGIVITGGAIFGAFYKVTSPTILAPWFALALLVIGFASTWVLRARDSATSQLADLNAKSPV